MKTAAIVNYFNDLDMLQLQFERNQFDYYDHVYIIDGPYQYTKTLLPFYDSPLFLVETDFGKGLLNNPKVTIVSSVYKDEIEKRRIGYQLTSEDLIFIRDTDEFCEIDASQLNLFIESEKAVAGYRIQNLCLNGFGFARFGHSYSNIKEIPLRFFVFKKSKISAEDYLDYLWIIGEDQKKPIQEMLFLDDVGVGYHFTQMRSYAGQSQKFLFYTALHQKSQWNENIVNDINKLNVLVNDNSITKEEAVDIYLRAVQPMTLAPSMEKDERVFNRLSLGANLEKSLELASAQRHKFKSGRYSMLIGYSCYFFVYPTSTFVHLKLLDGVKLYITIIEYLLDSPPNKIVDDQSELLDFVFEVPKGDNKQVGYLFHIRFYEGNSLTSFDITID